MRGIRALGIRGCSVSMPFKEAVIPLVDVLEASAAAIESVNTIVNDAACSRRRTPTTRRSPSSSPSTRSTRRSASWSAVPGDGEGRRGRLPRCGFRRSDRARAQRGRRRRSPRSTATRWVADDPEPGFDVIVNVTPLGMHGADAAVLAFSPDVHRRGADRVRRRRLPGRDPADRRRRASRQARDHRGRGDRPAGGAPVRALHRRARSPASRSLAPRRSPGRSSGAPPRPEWVSAPGRVSGRASPARSRARPRLAVTIALTRRQYQGLPRRADAVHPSTASTVTLTQSAR